MIKNIQYSTKRKMYMILLENFSISLPESIESKHEYKQVINENSLKFKEPPKSH